MKNIIFISKTSIKILFALSLLTFFFTSCGEKKGCTNSIALNFDSEAEKDDGSCQLAGLGGNTTIVAFPHHHGEPIFNFPNYRDTAYLKFNTQEYPGSSPSSYDATFIGDDVGKEHVHLEGLKAGKYYIYMVGWDTTINQRVTGGIPYILTQATGEVDVDVPVTE